MSTYLHAREVTRETRERFVPWLTCLGYDPNETAAVEIDAENGRARVETYARDPNGRRYFRPGTLEAATTWTPWFAVDSFPSLQEAS